MDDAEQVSSARDIPGPWFRRHPRSSIVVAFGLFGGVFAAQFLVDGARAAIAVLYVLPITLMAMSFGFRWGLAAGGVGVGLLVSWELRSAEDLSALEWLSRATPMLLLGALVGIASDRLRDAERIERRAAAVALLQREAAEVNDELVQGLALTKWLFEAGETERGLVMLEENLVSAQQLVSRMLGSDSILPGDVRRSQKVHHSPSASPIDPQ
jgi:glucose-6-phosphate-specific signal transduction histidine kinase